MSRSNGSSPAGLRHTSRPSTYVPAFPKRYGPRYAAYWQRLGAMLVDGLVFVVLVAVPSTLITWWFGDGGAVACSWGGDSERCPQLESDIRLSRTVFYAIASVFFVFYSWLVGRGSTIGRRATEYKIVDAATMEPIGLARGMVRTAAMAISAAPAMLGFLWPLWDPQRRTFHDMIARSLAVSP